MIRHLTIAGLLVLAAGLSACGTGSGDEQPQEESGPSTPPPATEPAEVSIEAPEGFSEVAIYEPAFPLAETYKVQAFRINDSETEEMVYVTSYLLPDSMKTETSEQQAEIVTAYDEQIENSDSEGIANLALVNGKQGLYRWAKIAPNGEDLFQANTFLFSRNQAVIVTCQYVEQRDVVEAACQEALDSLVLPEEWA